MTGFKARRWSKRNVFGFSVLIQYTRGHQPKLGKHCPSCNFQQFNRDFRSDSTFLTIHNPQVLHKIALQGGVLFFFSGEIPVEIHFLTWSSSAEIHWMASQDAAILVRLKYTVHLKGVFLSIPWKRLLSNCSLRDGHSSYRNLTSFSHRFSIRAFWLSGSKINRRDTTLPITVQHLDHLPSDIHYRLQ